jgi:hypothetical protein
VGASADLSCIRSNDDDEKRLTIKVAIETAACKVYSVRPKPSLIQKMVVVADFGETIDLSQYGGDQQYYPHTESIPRYREIVVPNIYTTTPITFVGLDEGDDPDPSMTPTPAPSSAPSPSPTPLNSEFFEFPLHERNEPRIYTEFGKGGPNSTDFLWRVVMSNLAMSPPTEVLDFIFPSVDNGGIVICETDESLEEACGSDTVGEYVPLTNDGHGFWFYLPPAVMNTFVGTHGGEEAVGTPTQLGIDPLQILAELEHRLEHRFYFKEDDPVAGELPDICNGDVQVTLNEDTAMDGLEAGRFTPDVPFMYLPDFHDWIVENHLPAIPGVCGIMEDYLIKSGAVEDIYGDYLKDHQEGIDHLDDATWVPPDYDAFKRHIGDISSHATSGEANVPLFKNQKRNWFSDGAYLYHRLTTDALHDAYDRAREYANSENGGAGTGGFGTMQNMAEVIANMEENNAINFFVDVNDELLIYQSSTSLGNFKNQSTCGYFIDDNLTDSGSLSGFITSFICAPDLAPGIDDDTLIFYELFFQCTDNITLLVDNPQETVGFMPGECKTMQTPFLITSPGLQKYFVDNKTKLSVFDDPVFSDTCTIDLLGDTNSSGNVTFDATIVTCEAQLDAICENLGACDPSKPGFWDKHGTMFIADFVMLFLALSLFACACVATKKHNLPESKIHTE